MNKKYFILATLTSFPMLKESQLFTVEQAFDGVPYVDKEGNEKTRYPLGLVPLNDELKAKMTDKGNLFPLVNSFAANGIDEGTVETLSKLKNSWRVNEAMAAREPKQAEDKKPK